MKSKLKLLAICHFLFAICLSASAQGTAFTYQGRLNDNGAPANGTYDLVFTIYASASGTNDGFANQTNSATLITNGLFTVTLNLGLPGIFTGPDRWLEIDVRTNGNGAFTTLAPRQQLTPTPYAIFANTASNLSGTIANGALPASPSFSGTVAASSFSGSGANLTALNAGNISSGTLADARLSANVALLGNYNTYNYDQTFNGAIVLNSSRGYQQSSLGGFFIDAPFVPGGRLTVLANGNVGIGNPSPLHTLEVNGDATFAGSITGNGGGLTNVTAATLAIPPGMAFIPAGVFTMGNSIGDGDITDANPTNITVSAFYMDVNLVSLSQWQSVYYWATSHGYGFVHAGAGKAANHPVQTVDWYDAVKWSNARARQAGLTPVYYTDPGLTQFYTNGEVTPYMNLTANGYRLPTEAEWEKAAQGGLNGQRFPWGNVITENLANYYGVTSYSYDLGPNGYNAAFTNGLVQPYTSPVGYFAANGYGLYDMAGNVFEWCWDWHGTPYGQPTTTNPTGPGTGSLRVLRGGDWIDYSYNARCANRNDFSPGSASVYTGFRCVRGL